jgi:hypothetical protein
MITLLKIFPEKWEQAKGFLRLDLEAIEAAMNQRWSVTFGASNLLQPDTIAGDFSEDSRYVSNQGDDHMPFWDQVNLANGVKNRLPFSNFVAATAGAKLVGRGSGAAGDFEEISVGPGLVMQSTTLSVDLGGIAGRFPIPDEPYFDDPWAAPAAGSLNSSTIPGPIRVEATQNADQAFTARFDAFHHTAYAGSVFGQVSNVSIRHTSGTMTTVVGMQNQAYFGATGNVTDMVAGFMRISTRDTAAAGASSGTVTNTTALYLDRISNQSNSVPTITFTSHRQIRIINALPGGVGGITITNCAGIQLEEQTPGTNNSNLVIGQTTIPSGTWSIYNASTRNNYLAGPVLIGGTTAAGAGTNYLSFANGTAVTSTAADTSAIYAADTATGDSNLFATNEQDYVTQLTGLDIAKTADESVANNTPQNDDHLVVNLPASSRYQFKFYLFATSPATAGLLLQLDGTAGVSSLKANIQIFDSTGALVAFARKTAFNSSTGVDFTGDAYAVIEGVIEVSTAGTFRLEWAQNTTDAGNATVLQENSSLRLRRLNA